MLCPNADHSSHPSDSYEAAVMSQEKLFMYGKYATLQLLTHRYQWRLREGFTKRVFLHSMVRQFDVACPTGLVILTTHVSAEPNSECPLSNRC